MVHSIMKIKIFSLVCICLFLSACRVPGLEFVVEKLAGPGECFNRGNSAIIDFGDCALEASATGQPAKFRLSVKMESKGDSAIELDLNSIMIMNGVQEKFWPGFSKRAVTVHSAAKGKSVSFFVDFEVNLLNEKYMAYIPFKNTDTGQERSAVIHFRADSATYRKFMDKFMNLSKDRQAELLAYLKSQ